MSFPLSVRGQLWIGICIATCWYAIAPRIVYCITCHHTGQNHHCIAPLLFDDNPNHICVCVCGSALQAANTSFKSAQGGGSSNPKGGVSAPPGGKSFKRSASKMHHPSGHASQDGGTSVMSKMKRSMTLLAGRPVSEAGMTERSNRVSPLLTPEEVLEDTHIPQEKLVFWTC